MKNLKNCIQQQAREKMRADRMLRDILCRDIDPALIDCIEFIQLKNGVLELAVGSAAWASRLRFFGDTMLSTLRVAGLQAHSVKTHIALRPDPQELIRETPSHNKHISDVALEGLASLAGCLEESELKQSLNKLIEGAERKNRR